MGSRSPLLWRGLVLRVGMADPRIEACAKRAENSPPHDGSPAASGAITEPPSRFEHSASLATAASARRALRRRPGRRERRDTSFGSLREAAVVGARRYDEHR